MRNRVGQVDRSENNVQTKAINKIKSLKNRIHNYTESDSPKSSSPAKINAIAPLSQQKPSKIARKSAPIEPEEVF